MIDVSIEQSNDHLNTSGLIQLIDREFKILIKERAIEDYERLLKYLINYVIDCKPSIKNDQTISFHSWLLKFVDTGDSFYEIWEAKNDGQDFVRGADYSLGVIRQQEEECKIHNVSPVFPTFSQNIVISNGVYEGMAIDAVRYPSPNHMTGWWLTTELYDDNLDSLKTVHYFHLAFKRPDLLRYLALPFGYRFLVGNGKDVWFDEKF
jgi:hypothetical protein